MSEIKLNIDGTDYETIYEPKGACGSPEVYLFGKWYFAKPKEKDIPTVKPDWEVTYISNKNEYGEHIFSVKRLSDNCVFTIGDKFNANAGHELTIKRFEIDGIEMKVWSKEHGYWLLCFINPIPKLKVLFTTEDGVEIFEHDHYYSLNKDFIRSGRSNGLGWYNPQSGEKYFSTEDKRTEYILLNKPIEVSFKTLFEYINSIDYKTWDTSLRDFFIRKINP